MEDPTASSHRTVAWSETDAPSSTVALLEGGVIEAFTAGILDVLREKGVTSTSVWEFPPRCHPTP